MLTAEPSNAETEAPFLNNSLGYRHETPSQPNKSDLIPEVESQVAVMRRALFLTAHISSFALCLFSSHRGMGSPVQTRMEHT